MENTKNELVTLRNDEVRKKVRTLYMQNKSIKEIQELSGIGASQWDSAFYLNIQGFRDFMTELKKERILQNVERVSDKIIALNTDDNHKLLAIQQKEAEFVRETLLKDFGYSKRIETIGLNINKNEPLDIEQKAKLDNLLKKADFDPIKKAEIVEVEQNNPDNTAQ